jgi:hypothetical protein
VARWANRGGWFNAESSGGIFVDPERKREVRVGGEIHGIHRDLCSGVVTSGRALGAREALFVVQFELQLTVADNGSR